MPTQRPVLLCWCPRAVQPNGMRTDTAIVFVSDAPNVDPAFGGGRTGTFRIMLEITRRWDMRVGHEPANLLSVAERVSNPIAVK